jgi:hypothetical protein
MGYAHRFRPTYAVANEGHPRFVTGIVSEVFGVWKNVRTKRTMRTKSAPGSVVHRRLGAIWGGLVLKKVKSFYHQTSRVSKG